MDQHRKSSPLIRSSAILRGVATAITLTSLSGMTAFAATHVQNTSAPLQPSASASTAAQASTTSTTTTRTTPTTTNRNRRTTVTSGVGTTTAPARTKTAQS